MKLSLLSWSSDLQEKMIAQAITTLAGTALLFAVATIYIIQCPFNKVEESFNTQAVHDILNIFPSSLPRPIKQASEIASRAQLPWDHMQFPGVVPRTFIGSLMIGIPLKLIKNILSQGYLIEGIAGEDEPDFTIQFVMQIFARFMLASLLVLSLDSITRAIYKRYGQMFRLCFLASIATQFHYLYYAGRFLPNTFAAILANFSMAAWINRQYSKAIVFIAFCVVLFRFDTAIFFGCLIFDGVFIRRTIPLGRVFKIGIPAGLTALLLTFVVDSIFWARPLWPELESLYFNLWLNKSHEWGVQPYFWYIYNCIPRILMATAPMVLLAEHRITREYLLPTLAFIFIYSILPHKELRFILFTSPFLNICAVSGLMNIYHYLNKSFLWLRSDKRSQTSYIATFLFVIFVIVLSLLNVLGSVILARISNQNYPGGHAALSLGLTKEVQEEAWKSIIASQQSDVKDFRSDIAVYLDNLSAQTGANRFLQVDGVYYSKTPKLDESTFKKEYKLIFLVLEPKEIPPFIKSNCPESSNQDLVKRRGVEKWVQSQTDINCTIPNQTSKKCSITNTITSFKSVNIGGVIKRLKALNSPKQIMESMDDSNFIQTKTALHIIRCARKG